MPCRGAAWRRRARAGRLPAVGRRAGVHRSLRGPRGGGDTSRPRWQGERHRTAARRPARRPVRLLPDRLQQPRPSDRARDAGARRPLRLSGSPRAHPPVRHALPRRPVEPSSASGPCVTRIEFLVMLASVLRARCIAQIRRAPLRPHGSPMRKGRDFIHSGRDSYPQLLSLSDACIWGDAEANGRQRQMPAPDDARARGPGSDARNRGPKQARRGRRVGLLLIVPGERVGWVVWRSLAGAMRVWQAGSARGTVCPWRAMSGH